MPEFETYVDVSVDEFLSNCSPREIEKLIDSLIEDGYLNSNAVKNQEPTSLNIIEMEWEVTLDNLRQKRLTISNEDEEIIKLISKKY